ncbi:hypothetical protein LNN98_14225 [Klebsiella pneumoniae subsp. pneumoniae]|nr:hypothetical protein [Klebsiella pneumoniae]MCS5923351.1 hypothetical protein [Klebsiella pneumoniae subsp. pneumoniae]
MSANPLVRRQISVCIVIDYRHTLAQRRCPVGLRSWLMWGCCDDTARGGAQDFDFDFPAHCFAI